MTLKRRFHYASVTLALTIMLAPILVACGGDSPTATPVQGSTTNSNSQDSNGVDKSKLSKEINFYTWVNYMKPEVLDQFEKEFGVKVVLDTFDSNEALLAKLQAGAGGYDVIVPSDYMIEIMGKSDILEPLDKSMLTNLVNIDPNNLKPYYDPENTYSVPWKWGTSGFAYNADKVSPAPDSWAVMYDPSYSGKISMLNDVREVPAAAAHLLGLSENTVNPDDLAKIKSKILEQKPLVKAYTSDTNRDLLLSGETVLAQVYTNDGITMGEENPSIKYVIPKEGCTIWQDNLAIPKSAPNKYTAHVFINFLMREDIETQNAIFIKSGSPNKAARANLPAEIANNKGIYPDDATMQKLEWIQDLGDDIELYDRMWTEIKNE